MLFHDRNFSFDQSQILKNGEVLADRTPFNPGPLNNIVHAGISKGNRLEDRKIMLGVPKFLHQDESNLIMEKRCWFKNLPFDVLAYGKLIRELNQIGWESSEDGLGRGSFLRGISREEVFQRAKLQRMDQELAGPSTVEGAFVT